MKPILLLIALLYGTISNAQVLNSAASVRGDWTRLSEVLIAFDKNSGEMAASPKEKFMSVHFRLTEGQIELRSAVIYFENGEKQSITINAPLKPDQTTRVFELRGGNRIIKKVTFRYRTVAHTDDKRARLEFWASKVKKKTVE